MSKVIQQVADWQEETQPSTPPNKPGARPVVSMEDPLLGSYHLLGEKDVPRTPSHREPLGSLLAVVLIITMTMILLMIINMKLKLKPAAP